MSIVFYLIWLCLLTVLQPTLARGIEVFGIAPNLFLCFVVMAGFFRGKKEGAIWGAIFGLVYDMLIGRLIGVNSLCYLYLGFGAGLLSEHFFSGGKRLAGATATIIGTIIAGIVYYIAMQIAYKDISFVTAFFRTTLLEAIYNGVMGFLMTFLIQFSMKLFKVQQIS